MLLYNCDYDILCFGCKTMKRCTFLFTSKRRKKKEKKKFLFIPLDECINALNLSLCLWKETIEKGKLLEGWKWYFH